MKKLSTLFLVCLLSLSVNVFYAPLPAYAVTFTTWNPSDISATLSLSGGNLTVSDATNDSAQHGVRSVISKSALKWYWENKPTGTMHQMGIGIADSSAPLNPAGFAALTASNHAYIYLFDGEKCVNGSCGAYAASYTTNDVISVEYDATGGTLVFLKNGVSQGTIATGISGSYFAGTWLLNDSAGTQNNVANFGATAFAQTVPAGYCQGLSDTCVLPASFHMPFFDF